MRSTDPQSPWNLKRPATPLVEADTQGSGILAPPRKKSAHDLDANPWNPPRVNQPQVTQAAPSTGLFLEGVGKLGNTSPARATPAAPSSGSAAHPWNLPREPTYQATPEAPLGESPRASGSKEHPWNERASTPVEDKAQYPWNSPRAGGPSVAPSDRPVDAKDNALHLRALGVAGSILADLGVRSKTDLAYLATSEEALRETIHEYADNGQELYDDFEESSKAVVEAWREAKVVAPLLLAQKVSRIRDDSSRAAERVRPAPARSIPSAKPLLLASTDKIASVAAGSKPREARAPRCPEEKIEEKLPVTLEDIFIPDSNLPTPDDSGEDDAELKLLGKN